MLWGDRDSTCLWDAMLFNFFSVFQFFFDEQVHIVKIYFNPFIPVSAKTATSQVDLQVWKG